MAVGGYTYAHGDVQDMGLPRDGLAGHRPAQLFSDRSGGTTVRVRQQHRKLFAPYAPAEIGRAKLLIQQRTQVLQHQIACAVSVGVIDVLEVVHVDQQRA